MKRKKKPMAHQRCTFALDTKHVDTLDRMVKLGYGRNRAHVIRQIIEGISFV